jgi:hypothetical protein
MGYTAVLSDDTVASLEVATDGVITKPQTSLTTNQQSIPGVATVADTSATSFMDDEITGVSTTGKTITRTGSKFVLKAKPQANTNQIVKALLTIIGNETGGFKTVVVTVNPSGFLTQDIATGLAG